MLTWASLNIVGGGEKVAEEVQEAQREVYGLVDRQITKWEVEHREPDPKTGRRGQKGLFTLTGFLCEVGCAGFRRGANRRLLDPKCVEIPEPPEVGKTRAAQQAVKSSMRHARSRRSKHGTGRKLPGILRE